jgi:hypothetical protein
VKASRITIRRFVTKVSHFQTQNQKGKTTDFTDDTDKNFRIRAIREIRGFSYFGCPPEAERPRWLAVTRRIFLKAGIATVRERSSLNPQFDKPSFNGISRMGLFYSVPYRNSWVKLVSFGLSSGSTEGGRPIRLRLHIAPAVARAM